ncbi:MAG: hypothetical protein HY278_11615 [candidate division NC10 bacterium]|nr:hypothetical protein [candidate division NC10 bacterium]
MKAFLGLIKTLVVPLAILNMLGGIVSGIWLAVLGEWGTIGFGIVVIAISIPALGFALMPSMLLAVPAAHCATKGRTVGFLCLIALSNLYTVAIITVWCCAVLFVFVKDAPSSILIPTLIWSYGIATGPWGYMASKESQSSDFGPTLAAFMAQLAYLVIMLMVILLPVTWLQALKVFAGFMLVGLVIQTTIVYLLRKESRQFA